MLGEQLLIKMWETLAKGGVGGLASPWQIKREGKAHTEVRRHEMLLLAQTEQDIEEVRAGRKLVLPDGTLKQLQAPANVNEESDERGRREPTLTLTLLENMSANHAADKLEEAVNLAKTIVFAEEEIAGSQGSPPEENIDPDWFKRWRESAKQVTTEELQRLWAKTLAGEVKSPGSFSLRTLDFLRNLTRREADLITRLAPYVVAGFLHKRDQAYFDTKNLPFGQIVELEEMGFLSGPTGLLGLIHTITSQRTNEYFELLVCHDKALLLERDEPEPPIELYGYKITSLGREVLSLGSFKADVEYLELLAKHIKSYGFKVGLADWTTDASAKGRYFNRREL